ncbi:MAG: pyrroline-5-carboxylate reductase [Kiritimatiellae bacterium]|nr:pyrroline-5-carboxylate reductase [Kiritimatiellia bacterium]
MTTSKTPNLVFLGGGNMAEAILAGLLARKVYAADELLVAEIRPERRAELEARHGVATTGTPRDALAALPPGQPPVILLAVKPQQAPALLRELAPVLTASTLLLSICAGLPTRALEALVPCRVIRIMPNLPATVGHGVSALAAGARIAEGDLDTALRIFSAVGLAFPMPEDKLDLVTGFSGSGPGYVFAFMEALEAAGIEGGIPADIARQMAIETVLGAAVLAAAEAVKGTDGATPAVLRQRVSSPGGTTLAGLAAAEEQGLSRAVVAAVHAATRRSAELAQ